MKNCLYLLTALVLCACLFTGCDNEKDPVDDGKIRIRVAPEDIETFSHRGGTRIVAVTVSPQGTLWEAKAEHDWAKTKVSGGTLTIEVPEYMETPDRSNKITVSAEGAENDIILTLTQSGYTATGNETITAWPKNVSFKSLGPAQDIEITANSPWSAEIVYGTEAADWLQLGQTTGSRTATVAINAKENIAKTPRTARIIFTSGEESASIAVTQDADIIDIEEIIGEWDASGDIIMRWTTYKDTMMYPYYVNNPHTVTFKRIGKNSIEIQNIGAIPGELGDALIATLNPEEKTLSIPAPQKMVPKWFSFWNDEAYYLPCNSGSTSYAANWTNKEQFHPIPIERTLEGGLELMIASGQDLSIQLFMDEEGEIHRLSDAFSSKTILLIAAIRGGEWFFGSNYAILGGDKWTKNN